MTKVNLSGTVIAGLLALFSTGSFAAIGSCPDPTAYPLSGCNVNDVRPSGFPYFDQLVDVRYQERRDGFDLNAKFYSGSFRSHLYVSPTDILDISKTKLKFKGKVRDGVASGTLSIKGSIDELGIKSNKKNKKPLMKADLSGEWNTNRTGDLIGFNTENIVCHDKINEYLGGGGCTTSESFYLSLLESITTGESKITTAGIAVTTIPLPAAAWLLGSGLLGLIGISRRKSDSRSVA